MLMISMIYTTTFNSSHEYDEDSICQTNALDTELITLQQANIIRLSHKQDKRTQAFNQINIIKEPLENTL